MAGKIVDLVLRTKSDLSGVDQLRRAVVGVQTSMNGLIGAGAKLGIGFFTVQGAARLLVREVRDVVQNIDKIPGVSQDAIEVMGGIETTLNGLATSGKKFLAEGILNLSLLPTLLFKGEEAAVRLYDSWQDMGRAAVDTKKKQAELTAENRRAAEAMKAAEKAAADYAAALKTVGETFAAENQVGESIGQRINRLNAEAARIDSEADGKPITEQLKLRAEASRRRTEAAQAALQLNERAAQLGQKQADAEFARIASTEKLVALRAELAAIDAETALTDIADPVQWERAITLEERRLEIGQQILAVQRSIADVAGDELTRISEERTQILQNRLLDETTARARLAENTAEYRRQLERVIALRLEERALTGDSDAVARIDAEIAALRRRSEAYGRIDEPESRISLARRRRDDRNDPSQSFQGIGEGVEGGALDFLNQLGTTANNVAATVSGTLNAALAGTKTSIEGLIKGTTTWRDALRNVGVTIATSVVSSIATMFAEWIAGMLLQATVGKTIQAGAVAAAIPVAAATSAIWAVPATLATIASFGGAAAQAPISIAIAKGTVLASSVAGFEEGGFTAPGPAKKPAGVVHAGEWVAPKWMVESPLFQPAIAALEGARMGRPGFAAGGFVDSMRAVSGLSDQIYGNLAARGAAIDSARAGLASVPAQASARRDTAEEAGRPLNLTLVDSRREANRIQWNSSTEDQIVEIVRRNRSRVMT